MIVPDRAYTFDKNRETTNPYHIINDYHMNITKASYEEYLDFYTHFVQSDGLTHPEGAREAYESNRNFHVHTFTLESLTELLEAVKNLLGFDIIDIKRKDNDMNIGVCLQKL
jgi:hypothetical protein